jgi:hypothetical protein
VASFDAMAVSAAKSSPNAGRPRARLRSRDCRPPISVGAVLVTDNEIGFRNISRRAVENWGGPLNGHRTADRRNARSEREHNPNESAIRPVWIGSRP